LTYDPPRPHDHFWHHMFTRGQFLRVSTGAAAGLATSGFWLPRLALAEASGASVDPRPIPGGIQPFGPGTPFIHVFGPAADAEPNTITDFDGLVATAIVRGTGKATDTSTGKASDLVFDSDMRLMKGAYRALDGSRRNGSFAFV
jgi:hypothetical protein